MGVLTKVFGPSRRKVWQKLSNEIGGEFIRGGFWKGDKVEARVGGWTVTLDTYVLWTGKTYVPCTRIRAPYVNMDGFRFRICRRNLFSGIGRLLGMPHIEAGDPEFNREFDLKSNNPVKAIALFSNEKIRRLIRAQSSIHFETRGDGGWFGTSFPEGVDELRFQATGSIHDVERLKSLYDLFAEVLHDLCQIGSAREPDPRKA